MAHRRQPEMGRAGSDVDVAGLPDYTRPGYVSEAFRVLAEQLEAHSILDPCSSSPSFTARVAEATSVERAIALGPVEEVFRKVADHPSNNVEWSSSHPVDAAHDFEDGSYDFVFSSPAMGHRVDKDRIESTDADMLMKDLADWAVAFGAPLSRNYSAFQVADRFFTSPHGKKLRSHLSAKGVSMSAAISLADGIPGTTIRTRVVVFSRDRHADLLVGRLSAEQEPGRLIENMLSRTEGASPEYGRIVDPKGFSGWAPIQAHADLRRRMRVPASELRTLDEIAIEVNSLRLRKGDEVEAAENALYLYTKSNKVTLDPPPPPTKENSVFTAYEVNFDLHLPDARIIS